MQYSLILYNHVDDLMTQYWWIVPHSKKVPGFKSQSVCVWESNHLMQFSSKSMHV